MATVRRGGFWRATLVASAMIVLSACNAPFISGWVPYWNAPEGRLGFTSAAAPMFADVSPFFYSAQPDGTIAMVAGASANQLKLTVDAAHARGMKVLPTITDGSGKWMMATVILANNTSRAQHIANIVALTANPEIDGIDLDYEGFAFSDGHDSWATTQPVWVTFVTELAAALHANGKLLSVTIPPTWLAGGVPTGYPVYAQASIAPVVDRLRLMVYDWSVSSPGPISPMSWLNQVIAYSNAAIPAASDRSKLQLGVPSYGRDWGRQVNAKEICPDGALNTKSIELQNMQSLIDAHGATPTRLDPSNGEMYFTYDVVVTGYSTKPIPAPPFVPPAHSAPVIPGPAIGVTSGLQPALRLTPPLTQLSCTVRHFVYYPDATSIQQHAQAALSAGWSGVVIWALGYETADVYTALANTSP
ncbi:MAG: glycosyl hydrolase family 18 protein [Ilumatobacteraceae bacterium]